MPGRTYSMFRRTLHIFRRWFNFWEHVQMKFARSKMLFTSCWIFHSVLSFVHYVNTSTTTAWHQQSCTMNFHARFNQTDVPCLVNMSSAIRNIIIVSIQLWALFSFSSRTSDAIDPYVWLMNEFRMGDELCFTQNERRENSNEIRWIRRRKKRMPKQANRILRSPV